MAEDIAEAIQAAYHELCRRAGRVDADVAVRSSATAEDLPDASLPDSRKLFLISAATRRCSMPAALLRVALHRSRDQLPPSQGL